MTWAVRALRADCIHLSTLSKSEKDLLGREKQEKAYLFGPA